jgi:tetratricopeptide (TPR) repeat protein
MLGTEGPRIFNRPPQPLLDAFALIGRGQFHRSRASFEKRLRSQKSSDPATLLGLAAACILDGDPSSATAKTRLAWAAVSDDLFELVTVAAYYAHSGRHDEALFALMRARAMASDHGDDAALIHVCRFLQVLGESREAIKLFTARLQNRLRLFTFVLISITILARGDDRYGAP